MLGPFPAGMPRGDRNLVLTESRPLVSAFLTAVPTATKNSPESLLGDAPPMAYRARELLVEGLRAMPGSTTPPRPSAPTAAQDGTSDILPGMICFAFPSIQSFLGIQPQAGMASISACSRRRGSAFEDLLLQGHFFKVTFKVTSR